LSAYIFGFCRFEESLQVNILVTGAAGYIGSVCSEVLVSRGMSVIALDSLLEGHRAAVPRAPSFARSILPIALRLKAVFTKHRLTP